MIRRVKYLVFCTMLLFVLNACKEPAHQHSYTEEKTAKVIRELMRSQYEAFTELDSTKFLSFYTKDSDFMHAADGQIMQGRANLNKMIIENYQKFKEIKYGKLDSIYVYILGPHGAVATSTFQETIIDTSGNQMTSKGVWTNVFVEESGGWEVVHGHASHLEK